LKFENCLNSIVCRKLQYAYCGMIRIIMIKKVCTKCGEEKPLSEFCKDKRHKDGYGSHCKICRKILYFKTERYNAYHRAYQKEFCLQYPEKVKVRKRKYREKNRGKIRAYDKGYRARDYVKLLRRTNQRIHRYRKQGALNFFQFLQIQTVLKGENNGKDKGVG